MKKNRKILLTLSLIIIFILFYLFLYKNKFIKVNLNKITYFMLNEQEINIDEQDIKDFYVDNEQLVVPIYLKDENSVYTVEYSINNNKYNQNITGVQYYELIISLQNEMENNILIEIYKNDSKIFSWNRNVLYVKSIRKQFLSEIEFRGIQDHLGLNDYNLDKEITLLNALGINNIRTNIRWSSIGGYNREEFNYEYFDNRMQKLENSNINILVILDSPTNYMGEDEIISTEEEKNKFINYAIKTANHFENINNFEILNEPNFYYNNENGIEWYTTVAKEIVDKMNNKNIISGGTVLTGSKEFIEALYKNNLDNVLSSFSFHLYDNNQTNGGQLNKKYNDNLTEFKNLNNKYGGFYKFTLTETGVPNSEKLNITEDMQSNYLIQQSVILNKYCIDEYYIYNFRNTDNSNDSNSEYYGVVDYDYKPKKSYFALKNYYENTNGAEYIGTVNLAEGLEAHVYDKDGKPKIIVWSTNTENSIELPYENFTASNIYGNEIENTDGTIEITTSPVYLDNISDEYFYEAISNTTLEKYEEFEEKFEAEIANINGLQEEINKLKEYMVSIASNSTEDENVAIEQMNTHFNLGNVILSAYKNGSLDVEYVKLSSMLDMLNDIGNSYEDLLTVCATTRAPYYTATEELINSAESKINNNSDLEIVYPSKILDFAKELDEKSEYINSLSEENDIKTGLIVSNSLHAYYLSDWANEFASIYIDEYIEANPVTVSYSNTDEWTNQDVTATLNIGNDATVTNNGGSNTYIFKSNGSFTFEYERRGQAFKLEAKVSNIDKTYPTITGVKDGQTYTNSVKPVIEDTNLSIVSISYNGENMEYYDGITLEDEGMYSIVATDRAGNTTTVEFNIISDVQDEYVLQGNYLLNVWQETTLANFKNNYTSQEESYIIKRNDTELTDTDIIATGDIIELSSGDTYTIVVAGDINCDGRVTVFDLSALRRYILKQIEFTEIELLSADINIDGNNIGAKDYSRMRLEILGMH